ncbi:hypothetical protein [Sedimenticola hydrogenitrophicus]|uniref:hypothetical protein n=1 Tax=Sedimenticola hydrogenitrophicus TaxID=2967975 RepID=UPI0023AFCF6E|nr:hypothetical protein [Sedimenticola hydrogenitrophicus]
MEEKEKEVSKGIDGLLTAACWQVQDAGATIHVDNLVGIVREEFGKSSEFTNYITYYYMTCETPERQRSTFFICRPRWIKRWCLQKGASGYRTRHNAKAIDKALQITLNQCTPYGRS